MNAYALFENSLHKCADKAALISGAGKARRTVSFHDLNLQIDTVASQLLKSGLCAGDRVLLAVPMSIETYVVMLAVMKAGMITMFIDPAHSAATVSKILKSWPPTAVVSTRSILLFRYLLPELRRIPQRFVVDGQSRGASSLSFANSDANALSTAKRSPADSALLTFTSGSTGAPKPVLRTHSFLGQQLNILHQVADLQDNDIDYVAMPMFVLFNLASSVTSVIPSVDMKQPGRADPAVIYQQMCSEQVTRVVASPALLERLADYCLAKRLRLPGMRCFSTGGGPVSPLLARKLKRSAPAAAVKMVYGSTEAEPIACLDDCDVSVTDRQRMACGDGLLVGKPVTGCRVEVIRSIPGAPIEPCSHGEFQLRVQDTGEIGEIVVNGDHVLKAYAESGQDRATKIEVDGSTWHRTGDAGYFDDSGRLWLVGRCTAAIHDHRGTVYPFQVEYSVNALSGVRRSALVGHNNQRVLVLETPNRDFGSDCIAAARCVAKYSIDRIIVSRHIPMDKRHGAKIDYPTLLRQLDGGSCRGRFLLVGSIFSAWRTVRRVIGLASRCLARGSIDARANSER